MKCFGQRDSFSDKQDMINFIGDLCSSPGMD